MSSHFSFNAGADDAQERDFETLADFRLLFVSDDDVTVAMCAVDKLA